MNSHVPIVGLHVVKETVRLILNHVWEVTVTYVQHPMFWSPISAVIAYHERLKHLCTALCKKSIRDRVFTSNKNIEEVRRCSLFTGILSSLLFKTLPKGEQEPGRIRENGSRTNSLAK